MTATRFLACLPLLLLLAQGAAAQDAEQEYPFGFYWRCSAAMDGAEGRFSGSLQLEEDGSSPRLMIEWRATQAFESADWQLPGVLSLSAFWPFDYAQSPFDGGRLHLVFKGGRKLPKYGQFDFGGGPGNGTYVVSFNSFGPGRKLAVASLELPGLVRWVGGQDRLNWRMQGGRNGSGDLVTSGVLPTAFLPQLESEFDRFRSELLAKSGRLDEECEKVAYTGNEPIII